MSHIAVRSRLSVTLPISSRLISNQRLAPIVNNSGCCEFARAGRGVAPVPSVLLKQLRQESGLRELGPARMVRGEFYAISMERSIKHPAVLAICKQADRVFEQRP